nr:MAG TPA: hypothetical protein [Caudoviricetes sp.]
MNAKYTLTYFNFVIICTSTAHQVYTQNLNILQINELHIFSHLVVSKIASIFASSMLRLTDQSSPPFKA